ncbi:MAG TPA: hypothetical protein VHX62_02645 [Solirubrobacteraceae bacterium]|jgi:hypothetical protein|nr:hypothetical protein [Solirubrobacteraceae bacterium]
MSDDRSAGRRGVGSGARPETGQLLKRNLLGSEAIYRVVGENDRGVEVEVVSAPGLQAGVRFTFALDDVLAMHPLATGESRPAPEQVRGLPRRKFA